jgi:hypothetical protein
LVNIKGRKKKRGLRFEEKKLKEEKEEKEKNINEGEET